MKISSAVCDAEGSMKLSDDQKNVLSQLNNAGYEAYLVGGCVRDALLGRECHDTDVTTNALPEEIMSVFGDCTVIPTGIRHGTVTVIINGKPTEITTYRIDGSYTDFRRPDSVSFSRSLSDDLLRRDFTINALAADADGNIIDRCGGLDDLSRGIIRCVGEPEKRFSEDALRILRAVRFSSQLGFGIDSDTSEALLRSKTLLCHVSEERIREELDKLICGANCVDVLLKYREIIAQVIPEFRPCFDFQQHSHFHRYTVYEHIVRAVGAAPNVPDIRRTMLFHDIGKPPMFTIDEHGEGHFKGHAGVSADMAHSIMKRLKYDNRTINTVCLMIAHHSDKIRNEQQVRHMVSQLGIEAFMMLIEVKKSDNLAKNDFVYAENIEFDRFARFAEKIVGDGECLSIAQLAVNGSDVTALGAVGSEVGNILRLLLDKVIDGELENSRDELINYVKSIQREQNKQY